ncbi:hypothetical protein QKU58_gp058 [Pyramimonas orientalis virus]|uniref:Uncharacterized protein n=1 Tax=Pyramimonas orientalis virus 01B TaxID=3134525 RepID=A0A7M3UNK8_9VIRU|nr:hypothetical protein QKU58_gp058 [Pyramimonas orientalis virus]QOI90273.1 hypothetical protein HWQ62_00136 [Pyramimonas orientalis virus]
MLFTNSNAYSIAMIVINFICILVLYILVMYLFSKYMDIEEKVLDNIDYRMDNDRQLTNLIRDINYNDNHITSFIKSQHTDS